MKKTVIIVLLLCSIVISVNDVLSKTILESSTEEATAGEITPRREVVDAILASVDSNDLASFKECVKEIRNAEDSTCKLFRTVQLPSMSGKEEIYFVRPSLKPYCHTFYGAHLFRYWIVKRNEDRRQSSYAVRYAGTADTVELISSQHYGYPNINETNCWAVGCGTATLQYDGIKYIAVKCIETTSSKDVKESTKRVPCPKAYEVIQ